MQKEIRTICYDEDVKVEAYRFEGIVQPFPNHFHEHYVIGLMEKGKRHLLWKHSEFNVEEGNMIIFNPKENHECSPIHGIPMYFRGLNIPYDTMESLMLEITGEKCLPNFLGTVILDEEAAGYFYDLHQMIMEESKEFAKEESLLFLMSMLVERYSACDKKEYVQRKQESLRACAYMEEHYGEAISLQDLCLISNLSKSTLLRAFTKEFGVTPYRYLENLRINKAKQLLEKGISPIDAALRTGFCDQSHFNRYFTRFIGIAPGVYRDIFLNKDKQENIE